MVFSKLQPEPTFSPATTEFIASLSNNGKIKAGDIYAAAIHQLVLKVPEAISHKEFDAFVELSTKQDCTTDTQAHDLLKATQAEKYEGAFHKFFMCLDALFGPLRLFKGALDILCQCEPIFCAVWGAMKGLIQVRNECHQFLGVFYFWATRAGLLTAASTAGIIRLRKKCLKSLSSSTKVSRPCWDSSQCMRSIARFSTTIPRTTIRCDRHWWRFMSSSSPSASSHARWPSRTLVSTFTFLTCPRNADPAPLCPPYHHDPFSRMKYRAGCD